MTPKVGRELDALVAEKVMGQKVKSAAELGGLYSVEGDFFVNPPDRSEPVYAHTLPLPHYSTDIAAAWEVVEKLRVEGLRLRLVEYTDGFYAAFGAMAIDTAPWQASQVETAPLAICLAALKAVAQ